MLNRSFIKSFVLIVGSVLFSVSVFAGTHTYSVFESDITGFATDAGVSTQFNLSPQTGQAWVTSNLRTKDWSERGHFKYITTGVVKSLMEGLSYDVDSSQIVHQAGDVKTVCANVIQKRGIFRGKLLIQMTGHCTFNTEIAFQEDNSNPHLRMKKMLKVTLEVIAE